MLYNLNGSWGAWVCAVCETQHHNWDTTPQLRHNTHLKYCTAPQLSSTGDILKAQEQDCLGQQTPINTAGSLLHMFLSCMFHSVGFTTQLLLFCYRCLQYITFLFFFQTKVNICLLTFNMLYLKCILCFRNLQILMFLYGINHMPKETARSR